MIFKNVIGSNILTLANKFNKTLSESISSEFWYDYKIEGQLIVILTKTY